MAGAVHVRTETGAVQSSGPVSVPGVRRLLVARYLLHPVWSLLQLSL